MTGKGPEWYHRCEQCFACLQWCPSKAIEFGPGMEGKKRYHHPDITVRDMINGIVKRRSIMNAQNRLFLWITIAAVVVTVAGGDLDGAHRQAVSGGFADCP